MEDEEGSKKHYNELRSITLTKNDGSKVNVDVQDVAEMKMVFGPHFFVKLKTVLNQGLKFILGATHHGLEIKANEVNGDLDKFIFDGRDKYKNVD